MDLVRTFTRNRIVLLCLATLIIQSSVFVTATYIAGEQSKGKTAYILPPRADESLVITNSESVDDISELERLRLESDVAAAAGAIGEIEPRAEQPVVLQYKVKSGDTLSKIWKDHGALALGAVKAAEAIDKLKLGSAALRPGDEIELQLSSDGEITAFRKKVGDGQVLLLEGSSSVGYSAILSEEATVEEERTASGNINHSFSAAASAVNLPYTIVDQVVDLFSGQIEFRRDMQPGDTFSVVFTEKRSVESGDIYGGELNAASIVNSGQMLVAVRYQGDDGKAHFYNSDGKPIGNYFYRYPVQFSRISSSFSKSRFHPVLQRAIPHNGVDFAAPIGTPVRSVADGIVSAAGRNGGSGIMIKIKHGDRYETAYLHLSRISSGIKVGTRVSRGQVIGAVGMTGLATGPHLHFGFFDRGRYVDPLSIELPQMPVDAEQIPADYLQEMINKMKQQHKEMVVAGELKHLRAEGHA